ncbi:MAG: hypothetical protein Q4C61_00330 [Lachnospiraceae bacterium]|nr:hypothetical protein [Lachnospiraceae bacterium]
MWKDKLKTFFLTNWTMSEKCLLLADVLLFGILIGWLTSPFRSGFNFFSNNFRNFKNYQDDEDEREEEE